MCRIMAEFYAQASERGPDSMPFTTWIIKGMLKDAPADSQHSSDSMDVDDEGSAPSLVKETLLLVADDKVQGECAVLGPQWKLAYPPALYHAETERSFERVDAKEVYSFSPRLASKSQTAHKVAAISQLTTIHHDLRSTKEYVDVWESTEGGAQLGTIRAAVAWKEAGKVSQCRKVWYGGAVTLRLGSSELQRPRPAHLSLLRAIWQRQQHQHGLSNASRRVRASRSTRSLQTSPSRERARAWTGAKQRLAAPRRSESLQIQTTSQTKEMSQWPTQKMTTMRRMTRAQ